MSLGFGIFLMAAGAIVAFALPGLFAIEGANWTMIGYILMAAGALVTIFGIVQLARSGRSSTVTRQVVDPDSRTRVERTDRRDDIV